MTTTKKNGITAEDVDKLAPALQQLAEYDRGEILLTAIKDGVFSEAARRLGCTRQNVQAYIKGHMKNSKTGRSMTIRATVRQVIADHFSE